MTFSGLPFFIYKLLLKKDLYILFWECRITILYFIPFVKTCLWDGFYYLLTVYLSTFIRVVVISNPLTSNFRVTLLCCVCTLIDFSFLWLVLFIWTTPTLRFFIFYFYFGKEYFIVLEKPFVKPSKIFVMEVYRVNKV